MGPCSARSGCARSPSSAPRTSRGRIRGLRPDDGRLAGRRGALAVVVDWVGATTWQTGPAVELVAGGGFVATTALQAVPFEGRALPTYALSVGNNVVALAEIGVLLAVW